MASQFFGSCYARYRKKQDFAQKHPQLWAKQLNLKLHDSQIAYFEIKPTFQPNVDFFINLGVFNKALATNEMPPANGTFTNTVRDKLLNAKPFLNNKNEPATATDFWEMRAGIQTIPEQYKTRFIDEKRAIAYYQTVVQVFEKIRNEKMLTRLEAWEELMQTTPYLDTPEEDQKIHRSILLGDFVPSIEQITEVLDEKGELPCYAALNEWLGSENKSLSLIKAYNLMV